MRARRALLYTPGDDLKKIRKAAGLAADCICLDMEDGVAASQKTQARLTILEALKTLDFGRSERLARINPIGSGLESEDLLAVLAGRPDGIVIPKVEDGGQVTWASQQISAFERQHGWAQGAICLIAIVETARGLIRLPQIAGADPRLQALIFGADDYANDTGATRTQAGWEVFYARSAVVAHAAAFELQAIDLVYTDFNDPQGLFEQAMQGVELGFSGKQIIHPNQVQPVQAAFTPDDAAIQRAVQMIEAFERSQQAGKGAFVFEGKMVDAPVVKSAQKVLALAKAAGKIAE